ncbi:MAG: hypothetical protein J2P15_20570, partial [Micromonosporaceae bacterium]|nr:hypothetical protein [Micromonosporaceae bacterium]
MQQETDRHARRRMELLAPLERLLTRAEVGYRRGPVRTRREAPADGLLLELPGEAGAAQVTVVRAVTGESGRQWENLRRDPVRGYDLDSPGLLAFEVQLFDVWNDRTWRGASLIEYRLMVDVQAVADLLILWHRYPEASRVPVPRAEPRRELGRHRRDFDARQAAAAAPVVRTDLVLPEAADDLANLDPALLCWHFPRTMHGRYVRGAVVALAGYDCHPARRGPWLAAHPDGQTLVVTTDGLIGENQAHRWDRTPWLWDRRYASTPAQLRWQVSDPADVADVVDALDRGEVTEALTLAGVQVDRYLDMLLAGLPLGYHETAHTEVWVTRLYSGLRRCAPWRLRHA